MTGSEKCMVPMLTETMPMWRHDYDTDASVFNVKFASKNGTAYDVTTNISVKLGRKSWNTNC